MYITQSYKYRKDGIIYVSGTIPEGAEVLLIMDILNSENGYDLIRIIDNNNIGTSIWLRNEDIQENYREEEHKEVADDNSK